MVDSDDYGQGKGHGGGFFFGMNHGSDLAHSILSLYNTSIHNAVIVKAERSWMEEIAKGRKLHGGQDVCGGNRGRAGHWLCAVKVMDILD